MQKAEKRLQVRMLAGRVDQTYAMQTWGGGDFVYTLLNEGILRLPSEGFDFDRDVHIVYISREMNRFGCGWETIRDCIDNIQVMNVLLAYLRKRLSSHIVKRDFLNRRLKIARLGRNVLPCQALREMAA